MTCSIRSYNYANVSYGILALVNLSPRDKSFVLTLIVGFELGTFQFKKVLSGYALLEVFVGSGKRLA